VSEMDSAQLTTISDSQLITTVCPLQQTMFYGVTILQNPTSD